MLTQYFCARAHQHTAHSAYRLADVSMMWLFSGEEVLLGVARCFAGEPGVAALTGGERAAEAGDASIDSSAEPAGSGASAALTVLTLVTVVVGGGEESRVIEEEACGNDWRDVSSWDLCRCSRARPSRISASCGMVKRSRTQVTDDVSDNVKRTFTRIQCIYTLYLFSWIVYYFLGL